MAGISWTTEEEEKLANYFRFSTKSKLMNLLPDRTWKAINERAKRLGLKRSSKAKMIEYHNSRRKNGERHRKAAVRRYLEARNIDPASLVPKPRQKPKPKPERKPTKLERLREAYQNQKRDS